jgi:hypothetical protein
VDLQVHDCFSKGATSQAAEKLSQRGKKRQGTTSEAAEKLFEV